MNLNAKEVLCARCNVGLKGPTEPNPKDTFACPSCGDSDTLDNVLSEAARFVEDHLADRLGGALKRGFGASFKQEPRKIRDYRFKVNLDS